MPIETIRKTIQAKLNRAENYNMEDAPIHYDNGEASAWLSGRTTGLQDALSCFPPETNKNVPHIEDLWYQFHVCQTEMTAAGIDVVRRDHARLTFKTWCIEHGLEIDWEIKE